MSESASTSAVQARTDVVALLDLIAAEGTRTTVTDVTLARTDVPAALSPFSYVAPADTVLFLGITVLLLSSGVVESRRLGIMRRLAAAPGASARSVIAGMVATSLCVAAAQSAGLLLVGRLIFGVHWGNPAGVFLVLATLSLAYAGAAALVSLRSRSEEQAISLAVVLGIVCGMLGGCMYPLDVVGPAVRAVGHVVPQAWAMDAFVKLIYDHVGLASVLPEIGVLALFAAALGGPRPTGLCADGVLARVKAPGEPAELPCVVGPQRRVAAAMVQVPAATAALDPDRVLEPATGATRCSAAAPRASPPRRSPRGGAGSRSRWRCS